MDRNQVSVDFTNRLSTLLDATRNEEVTSELGLPPTDPREVLSWVLSSSVTSTPSSSASLNTTQQASIGFRSIGFGQCGLIFERPSRTYAIKIARPSFESALWADFQAHFAVYQAFTNHPSESVEAVEVRIPRIFSYVPKTNKAWWDSHLNLLRGSHISFPLPAMALITERILPLPKPARQALIDTSVCERCASTKEPSC
ncbi:hypothetical protein N7501_003230 [Penicillium viridicatum]|nr:hypothetical protein N7501_003230 [Penicillium viridicatum]